MIYDKDWVYYGNPANDREYEFECRSCGKPSDSEFCNGICFEAFML